MLVGPLTHASSVESVTELVSSSITVTTTVKLPPVLYVWIPVNDPGPPPVVSSNLEKSLGLRSLLLVLPSPQATMTV